MRDANQSYATFARYYDALTVNVQYEKRANALHTLLQQWQTIPDGKLLVDLACGTGSLSEELAKHNWDVIGIDRSAEMLNVAFEKKMESQLPVQYLQQDMRQLDLFGTVDVTLCMLDSLNHLETVADLRQVFSRVSLFSNPDALFAFDVNTTYKHKALLAEQCFVFDLPEAFCVWQNHLEDVAPTYPVHIQLDFFEITENGRYVRQTECFSEQIYEDAVLRALLTETGFVCLTCLDGDTFSAPTATTERLLYLARKLPTSESSQ